MVYASYRNRVSPGAAAARLIAAGSRGAEFSPDAIHYPDAATELDVDRLTGPSYSSTLPAWYNRTITRNCADLLFCCDRAGSPLVVIGRLSVVPLTEAQWEWFVA